jgi:flagellar biosynthetic protein FliQ
VNEATLAFVPKVLVIVGVLALTGPFMLATLSDYTQSLFSRMITVGTS